MQQNIFSVASITHAIKGRDILRKRGIKAYIEKKINTNGNAGCGYVIVAEGNRQSISKVLLDSNIKFSENKI